MENFTRQNMMLIAMVVIILGLAIALYRANKLRNDFQLVDLIMQDGKASRIGFAYIATLFVSSFVVIHSEWQGRLTELLFTAYLGAWVLPLVARVVGGTVTAVKNWTSTDPVNETAAGKGD